MHMNVKAPSDDERDCSACYTTAKYTGLKDQDEYCARMYIKLVVVVSLIITLSTAKQHQF